MRRRFFVLLGILVDVSLSSSLSENDVVVCSSKVAQSSWNMHHQSMCQSCTTSVILNLMRNGNTDRSVIEDFVIWIFKGSVTVIRIISMSIFIR
jgi:hypothetical protein